MGLRTWTRLGCRAGERRGRHAMRWHRQRKGRAVNGWGNGLTDGGAKGMIGGEGWEG